VSNIAKKVREKVSPPIPISILHVKSFADTCASTHKVSHIFLVAVPIHIQHYLQPWFEVIRYLTLNLRCLMICFVMIVLLTEKVVVVSCYMSYVICKLFICAANQIPQADLVPVRGY